MKTTISDEAFHGLAVDFQQRNGVSYSEALTGVSVTIEHGDAASTALAQFSEGGAINDTQLHAAAMVRMATQRVPYADALTWTGAQRDNAAASVGALAAFSQGQGMDDAQIDAAARMHAASNGGSYMDALNHVVSQPGATGTASFSEGAASAAKSPAQAMAAQKVEIFKAGSHIDSTGTARNFTVADVQKMASIYNPARHEAPMTLGHPSDDKPAYGWAKSLTATEDGRLLMMMDQVDAKFAEGVQTGRYKKRSASFYPPGHAANPVPGAWYLKHVGWLGAVAPAVRGLADANFGAPLVDGAVCFAS